MQGPRNIQITADGSATVFVPGLDVTFHSRHGAMAESLHVYLDAGLDYYHHLYPEQRSLRVFEMGFGTGLNALLTLQYAAQHRLSIVYETVELHPLEASVVQQLNYASQLPGTEEIFQTLHAAPWNEETALTDTFVLHKKNISLHDHQAEHPGHIVYYDAFAPGAQPDLWTEEVFKKLYDDLFPSGVLLTYCSKVDVRRALQVAGFAVQKIPGPRGKREILRATRPGL